MKSSQPYKEIYKIFQKDIEVEIMKGEVVRAKFLSGIFSVTSFFFCI